MSLKIKEKSVADTGAYEHLVALPNRSARRLPQTGPAGCESGTHARSGIQRATIAYPSFQRATNTGALGARQIGLCLKRRRDSSFAVAVTAAHWGEPLR